jgi:hypothetical protein
MEVSINEGTPIAGWSIKSNLNNYIKFSMDDNWGYPSYLKIGNLLIS